MHILVTIRATVRKHVQAEVAVRGVPDSRQHHTGRRDSTEYQRLDGLRSQVRDEIRSAEGADSGLRDNDFITGRLEPRIDVGLRRSVEEESCTRHAEEQLPADERPD